MTKQRKNINSTVQGFSLLPPKANKYESNEFQVDDLEHFLIPKKDAPLKLSLAISECNDWSKTDTKASVKKVHHLSQMGEANYTLKFCINMILFKINFSL